MSLVLQSSGGGQITIQEPTTASNFTQDLPAASGTVVITGTTPTLNGITFPATQVPSADANTLDDYEEGTWTPTIGGTATYVIRPAEYTKIGNLVFIRAEMEISVIGTGSAQFISGLPFSSSLESTFSISKLVNCSFNFYSAQLRNSGASVYISAQTDFDGTISTNQNFMQNGTAVQFSGFYRI
jgi:hypothetical protein